MQKKQFFISVVSSFLLVIFAVAYYLKYHYQKDLNARFKQEILDRLPDHFTCDFKEITIDENSLTLEDFYLLNKNKDSDTLWSVELKMFEVNNFNLVNFFDQNIILLDSVSFDSPSIVVYTLPKTKNTSKKDSLNHIKEIAKYFKINQLSIKNGDLTFDPPGGLYLKTTINGVLRKVSYPNPNSFLNQIQNNLNLVLDNTCINLPDSIQKIEIKEISFNQLQQNLNIKNLSLSSNFTVKQHFKHFKWNKSYLSVDVEKIDLVYPEITRDTCWLFKNIYAEGIHMNITKNDHFELPDRVTKLPQSSLASLPIKLDLADLRIVNSDLKLKNILKKGGTSDLRLSGISGVATIQNTNALTPALNFEIQASLQNKALLNTEARYYFGKNCPFTFNSSVSKVSMNFLDNYLKKSAGIELTKGTLDNLTLNLTGDKYHTKGQLRMLYSELQIHASNKKSEHHKKFLNTISDALGSLIFWKNNPSHKRKPRTSFINVNRDQRKAFTGQWIDALLYGILETIIKSDQIKEKISSPKKNNI